MTIPQWLCWLLGAGMHNIHGHTIDTPLICHRCGKNCTTTIEALLP